MDRAKLVGGRGKRIAQKLLGGREVTRTAQKVVGGGRGRADNPKINGGRGQRTTQTASWGGNGPPKNGLGRGKQTKKKYRGEGATTDRVKTHSSLPFLQRQKWEKLVIRIK